MLCIVLCLCFTIMSPPLTIPIPLPLPLSLPAVSVLHILARKLQHQRQQVAILRKLLRVSLHLQSRAVLQLPAVSLLPTNTAGER